MNCAIAFFFSFVMVCAPALGQVQPEVFTLDNGMKFILLQRSEEPNNVAAGWVAKVGSVNEHPGITGISHFFEHLMFKGTGTIGTSDATKDALFTESERVLRNSMLDIIWNEQYDRFKAGEIDDPWDEAYDTPRLAELRQELIKTMEEHRSVIIKDEFVSVYQSEGATGLNAFTNEDLTFFINQLPANKLELWCWMESDRLADSVFREFFSERDVVHEERRMRTESSPTGEFEEQFNSMFWQASPYSWPVIGWPSDLNSYTLEEARRYFNIYYKPNNLIGVLVGDFDIKHAKGLIKTYFGKLERGLIQPPPVPTIEPKQKAQQRMTAEVDAQSRVEVRYHAVPAGHKDGFVFDVIAAVLNERTGRLYKSMVEGAEIAASARASVDQRKYAGAFSFSGTVKGEATPEEIEASWNEQVALLQSEPVSAQELEKVKNNIIADQYRRLQSNFYLMIQLGFMEAVGGWEQINSIGDKLLAVTTEDITRVATTYLIPENSSVATYHRTAVSAPVESELADFDAKMQFMIKETIKQYDGLSMEVFQTRFAKLMTDSDQVPPELLPAFDYMVKQLQELLDAKKLEISLVGSERESNIVETDLEEFIEFEEIVISEAGDDDKSQEEQVELAINPQQLAAAELILASTMGKPLDELKQVYQVLISVRTNVSENDRPTIEYVIKHLATHIAEREGE